MPCASRGLEAEKLTIRRFNSVAAQTLPLDRYANASCKKPSRSSRVSPGRWKSGSSEITEDRRRRPRNDLTTVLANATLHGEPIPVFELFSLYFLIMVAGHDTTRNAISGGLLALLKHPHEFEKLRANPSLIETGADEIVRWTTPVNHFARTAAVDYVLRSSHIKKGDSVALFYASANRDEDIFADPFAFRLDRDPNPHLGFGVGEHFCLGAHLARLDLKVFFRQFAERVESIELAGPVQRLHASFVGGPKRLPIRYRLKPAPEEQRHGR
jgi:cytochrome P450